MINSPLHTHTRADESGEQPPPDFLSEMMSLNEEVDDAAGQPDRLERLLQHNQETQSDLQSAISRSFRQQDWHNCKRLLVRLKFYRSIENSIKQRIE